MVGRINFLGHNSIFLRYFVASSKYSTGRRLNFKIYDKSETVALVNNFRKYSSMRTVDGTRKIKTAGCLIIGDEILSGKILDTNSHEVAKFCFNRLSIPLTKTIVCSDDEDDIIESLRMLTSKCDLVITSGGIGPTHDDITYETIAKMHGLNFELDNEIKSKMHSLRGDYLSTLNSAQLDAFYKMATIPKGDEFVEKIFIDELWVPIVAIDKKIFVLPGVPQLFSRLLNKIEEYIKERVVPFGLVRYFVKTTTKESEFAPYLSKLQATCDEKYGKGGIKLGSYPHMAWQINTISIIGSKNTSDQEIRKVVKSIIENIHDSIEIDESEETKMTTQDP